MHTTLSTAPPLDDLQTEEGYFSVNDLCMRNTMPVSLLGVCAISLPCGWTGKGLPIGLQLIGRPFDEARLLRLAHAYEQAADWRSRRPEMGDFG